MKWLELHLDTQPAGIEPATELLSEYGIDSLMIDEEGDFKDFLENNHQYWDYVDDELMEQMHGKSRITFYLSDLQHHAQYIQAKNGVLSKSRKKIDLYLLTGNGAAKTY